MYGTPSCARCSKSVYAAEQVLGPGRKAYHRPCLSCTQCSKRLDSLSLLEHDEMPYCKPCHSRNFGTADLRSQNLPTAGRPMSPVKQIDTATSMESPVKRTNTGVATPRASPLKPSMTGSPRFALPPTPRCAACEKPVYFAEMVRALNRPYHRPCLRCGSCRTTLDPARLTEHDGTPMCNRCHQKEFGGGYAVR